MTKREMQTNLLEQVDLFQCAQEQLERVRRLASDYCGRWEETATLGRDLRQKLRDLELESWQKLAIWGLGMPARDQQKLRAAAYDRFMRDKIPHWLLLDGGTRSSSWMAQEEESVKEAVRGWLVGDLKGEEL